MKFRMCHLSPGDCFVKFGSQYAVSEITEKEIIYRLIQYWNDNGTPNLGKAVYKSGKNSQEIIERI